MSREVIIADGRPVVATRVSRKEAMERAELFVAKNLPKYLKKLHELAMGITAVKDTKAGPKIYMEPPDRQALQYLIDRGLGKIPDRVELTGEDGGPMAIIPWMPKRLLDEQVIDGEARDVTDESPDG